PGSALGASEVVLVLSRWFVRAWLARVRQLLHEDARHFGRDLAQAAQLKQLLLARTLLPLRVHATDEEPTGARDMHALRGALVGLHLRHRLSRPSSPPRPAPAAAHPRARRRCAPGPSSGP